MNIHTRYIGWAAMLVLAACKGDPGDPGDIGPMGAMGAPGDGTQCWDRNGDSECGGGEDNDGSGECDIDDCLGARGPAGPAGPAGPVGPAGVVGPQGPIGMAGAVGAQGAVGPGGLQGLPGDLGLQGVQGPVGVAGAAGGPGPLGNILAQFELDEDVGAVEFADASGQGNELTASAGAVSAGSGVSHAGKSITFNGTEGVQVAAGNTIADSARIGPELWMRTGQPGGPYTLLDKVGAYRLRMVGGQIEWTVNTTGGACTVSHEGPIAADTWAHVAGFFDGLRVGVSVNGVAKSVQCRSGRIVPSQGGALTLGGKYNGAAWSEVFRGNLDEVRVRSTADYGVGRIAGTCAVGEAIQSIGVDGTVTCAAVTPQRVIRWNAFDTFLESCCWVFDNNANLFGGVNPSNWTDNNAQASQMSASADVLRALFVERLYPGINAMINMERWRDNSSTNGRVTVALLRIRNTTQNDIQWTPYFYFTSYATWSERASVALNGVNVWNSGGGNFTHNSTSAPTLSIPANRTSTAIWVVPSSSEWRNGGWYRTTFLAFYNDSLNLPNGLQLVDDLDSVQGNLW